MIADRTLRRARPVRRPRSHGAALVIILAFVVLLAVLVLAFFSRALLNRQISDASANQTKVDILARSSIDFILGDLKQEIALRSEKLITNGVTLYYPLSPADMLPARSGNPAFIGATNDPIPNLIRRSVRNDPLAPDVVSVSASAVNSADNPAANGRSISRSRWNSHYLISRAQAGSDVIDSTPAAGFVAPDWVMVTKDGPVAVNTPDSAVIGRYAYAIYDEGGLLDVNVAGYPAGLETYPSAATNVVALKGSAGFADLSMVGVTNTDNLVGWRNFATARPAGSLGSYTFDVSALSNYTEFLTGATNTGFVTVATNSVGVRTDQRFPSRQALLKFQRAAGLPQDALQYLGTHTRSLEQPSFRPDPNRPKNTGVQVRTSGTAFRNFGGNDSYDPNGELQDQINPHLLAVRDTDGNPVLRERFPLSRLGLMEQAHLILLGSGSLPADLQTAIRQYFGLVWDGPEARWNYRSPIGNVTVSRIATLAEVAQDKRTPDFFEVLKAAIECGSLGKQHGGNDATGSPSRYTSGDLARDGFIDLQIFAIGANLIDQYDADSYPTRIQSAAGPGSAPPARLTCGVENIPTLAGAMTAWYRIAKLSSTDIDPARQPPDPAPGGNGMPYESATLIQPIIWNPHAPDSRPSPPYVPTDFQVQMGAVNSLQSDTDGDGVLMDRPRVRSAWWNPLVTTTVDGETKNDPRGTADTTQFPVPPGVDFQYPQAVINPASNWVRFAFAPGSFSEPVRLQAENYPPGSSASADSTGSIALPDPAELNEVGASARAIGFYAGMAWTGPVAASHPDAPANSTVFFKCLSSGRLGNNAAMRLQYRNPYGTGPAYLTYKVIDFLSFQSLWYSIVDADPAFVSGDPTQIPFNRGHRTLLLADPRTSRWGAASMNVSPAHWLGALPQGVTPPTSASLIPPVYYFPQGTTLGPDGISASGVSYRLEGDMQGSNPKASGWRYYGGNMARQNVADVSVNRRDGSAASPVPGGKFFHTDPDGVLRRSDGAFFNDSNGDGLPLRTGNLSSRPAVLNRPFRSVAEMGLAFRDTPWKTINFSTPESGDAALLDVFCLAEIEGDDDIPRVSGRVNLNTRQPRVLAALINGVSKAEGGILTDSEALAAANRLVEWTGDTNAQIGGVPSRGPLRNRGELVGKFVSTAGAVIPPTQNFFADVPNIDGSLAYSGYSADLTNNVFSSSSDIAIKRRHESVIRALTDSTQVRTWNLLIDVVAQSGRFSQSAGSDLGRFTVEGERRFWVHVAIDRLTGEVISKDVEMVTE